MSFLGTIPTRAAEKGLRFVVAGGHAVIVHGYPRNTFDVDLIVRRADKETWRELLSGAAYSFHREGPTFLQFNASNPETLPLDLMLVGDETFEKLMADAVPGPASAGGVKVVSLQHLLALKCHAVKHGHGGRIVKDADDVIALATANELDMDQPTIRDLFLKHGTAELYEKVQHLSRQG